MQVISVALAKGGVGKTTTVANIAAAKALQGARVLVVDFDPQGSLSQCFGMDIDDVQYTGKNAVSLFDINADLLDSCIEIETVKADNFYILVGTMKLIEAERDGINAKVFKKSIDTLSEYFDYVFLDCPPQTSQLTISALQHSNKVLLPCKTDLLSFTGLKNFVKNLKVIAPDIEIIGVIPTLYEKVSNDNRDILDMMKENYNVLGVIKKSAEAYKYIIDGLPTIAKNPKAEISQEYAKIANII